MTPLLQLTNEGIEYQDTEEIYTDVKNAFLESFPNLNVDDVDTPQGQIIAFITEKLSNSRDVILGFVNATFNGGFDIYEDINANAFFGVTRKPASPCVVEAKITGQPKTLISSTFRAKSGLYEFINSSGETTIKEEGYALIEMSSVETGEIQILANTLTTILTPTYGIETINNEKDSTSGTALETNMWQRVLDYKSLFSYSMFESYLANISNVTGVTAVNGYDNYSSQEVTYKGTLFQPHTFGIVVEGGEIKDIAEAMYKVRAPGAAMLGDVSYDIIGTYDNQVYTMRFSRPTYINLRCEMTLKLGKLADESYEEKLKNEMQTIIDNNGIGETIYSDNKKMLINIPNDIYILNIKLQKVTQENITEEIQNENEIPLLFLEKAQIALADITITIKKDS